MSPFNNFLQSKLDLVSEKGTLRNLRLSNPLLEDFVSNDYLGLGRSRELAERILKTSIDDDRRLNGSTGSRLLSGNFAEVEQLEFKLARIFKAESALLFNSGYNANLAVLSSLPQKGDTIFYDELVHASIKDGMRLSLAQRFSFRHNDLNDLEKKISKSGKRNIYVVVESIYSMDGDGSDLHGLVDLSEQTGSILVVDEAHSTGLFGDSGAGLAVSQKLHEKIAVRIYTFGKAMGVHGACVAGSANLKQFLINFARPFIYTTALSPREVISIECSFDHLDQNIALQKTLQGKIQQYIAGVSATNQKINVSAIQTAIIPGNENVKSAAAQFQRLGFDVRPIVAPTVPVGKERVRICLHTFNPDEKIKGLTTALNEIMEKSRSTV